MVHNPQQNHQLNKSQDGVFEQPCEVQNWLFTPGFTLEKSPFHTKTSQHPFFFESPSQDAPYIKIYLWNVYQNMYAVLKTHILKKTPKTKPKENKSRILQLRHHNHANPYHNQGLCICHYQKPLGYRSSSLCLTKALANTSNTNDTSPKKKHDRGGKHCLVPLSSLAWI